VFDLFIHLLLRALVAIVIILLFSCLFIHLLLRALVAIIIMFYLVVYLFIYYYALL